MSLLTTDENIIMDLGPCCACGKEGSDVRNIIMLHFEGPVPGKGWGCLVCNLPLNGATAVVCDECLENQNEIKFVFNGYAKDGRFPIEQLEKKPFKHDLALHPEINQQKCRICGCDELNPCIDDEGVTCHWVEENLCSACSDRKHKNGNDATGNS